MKIALLKSSLSHRGGLEKYTLRLARAFAKKNCAVTLLTTGPAADLPDVKVVYLGQTVRFSFYHLWHFDFLCKKWLKEHPQDAVFGMERTSSQTFYRAGSGVHAVYLKRRALTDSWSKQLSFHFNPLHRYLLSIEKKAFEDPYLKVLFTNSEMVRKEILAHYKIDQEKLQVVHNGVEWKEWESSFRESFETRKTGPHHFLFVGNGFRRKGLSFLLEGLSHLPKADWKLTVVGKDKEASSFQKQAQKLGIAHKVHFVGPQIDVRPFYQQADSLVIPSIYDPFSNVTLEALAMGLFVVSSRFNGAHEILTQENGVLIEELTCPQSVAKALKTALEHPKNFISASSIRQSIKDLDFSNQLDKIAQLCL